ncbi:PI-PLC domain-containing protein [Streptomyces antarcticus]|uniref:PI-PLC domain-containing protein n=1 Tax=Streptomyces antarcticus TaxID=2996458 RepID=UPI00226E0949|nr:MULTISPECIES: PI-PLC domain-containing protein [unclassified Streptomyces]MCY0940502.1 PI-PLC domain-containing protein [Streptomyces sp. H34-AA3]MCZ4082379.1 PI-PLC domain-containing protein [Streptomyces sp. H34-S5]
MDLSALHTPLTRRARYGRLALRAAAAGLVAAGVLVVSLLGVIRVTVLEHDWYDSVLERQRAYHRVYDEVLVDPRLADIRGDLLARLPVPPNQISSNLRLALPPATLRGMTDTQVRGIVAYLRGDEDELHFLIDLKPVANNLAGLAEVFAGDLIGDVPTVTAANAPALVAGVQQALDDLAEGRSPEGLPTLKVPPDAIPAVADAILKLLPAGTDAARAELRPAVMAALESGDAVQLIGLLVPDAFRDAVEGARAGLAAQSQDRPFDLLIDIRARDTAVHLGPLPQIRTLTALSVNGTLTLAVVAVLSGMLLLWLTSAAHRLGRLRAPGAALAAGGLASIAGCLLVRAALPEPFPAGEGSWAPSFRALTADLQAEAVGDFARLWLLAAAVPLLAGILLVTAAVTARAQSVPRDAPRAEPAPLSRARLPNAVAAVSVAAALGLSVFLPVPTGGPPDQDQRCNGSIELCDRGYDRIAYLTTHNAMSSTSARFIGPLQDPNITTQLDLGVRALMLDTYTWESETEIAARLTADDEGGAGRRRILESLIDRYAPARPGLWLCHSLCRAGAVPLVDTLRTIGAWMRANPDEVVTFIVQDAITGEQTVAALEEAGLGPLLATPPKDPDGPWPTLREMIAEDRRLMVFAERADGPDPRYRNFYRYAMETPYSYTSPQLMNCVEHRGGNGKRLFLMNNFVTDSGGSRPAAARVNASSFILDRARRCRAERGRPVNFIAVDYVTIGDALNAVDTLNAARGQDPAKEKTAAAEQAPETTATAAAPYVRYCAPGSGSGGRQGSWPPWYGDDGLTAEQPMLAEDPPAEAVIRNRTGAKRGSRAVRLGESDDAAPQARMGWPPRLRVSAPSPARDRWGRLPTEVTPPSWCDGCRGRPRG